MLGTPFNKRVRRVLHVDAGDDLTLTLDPAPSAYFPANLAKPQGDNGLLDGAPRTSLSPWRLTWLRAAELGVCDRVEVPHDATYELLSKPKPVMNGRRVVGYSAPVLPVDLLYPRSAELYDLGGEDPVATIACALYTEQDSQRGRGDYRDTFADAPPNAWEHFDGTRNRELRFEDGSVWRVMNPMLAPEVPYVSMTLKRAV